MKISQPKIVISVFCILVIVGFINFRNKTSNSGNISEKVAEIKTSPFPFPQSPLSTSSVIADVDFVEKQRLSKCPEDYISQEEYISFLALNRAWFSL